MTRCISTRQSSGRQDLITTLISLSSEILRRSLDSKSRCDLNLQYRSPPERKSCFVAPLETHSDDTIQVKYFPRLATEYLDRFAATPNLVPYLKVRCTNYKLRFSCKRAYPVGWLPPTKKEWYFSYAKLPGNLLYFDR